METLILVIGNIIVGIIALLGTVYSSQIKKSTDLVNFRIEALEKKIDKQDTIEKEMILLKEQFKTALEDIKDIQDQLKF